MELFGKEGPKPIESQAEVEREPRVHLPGIAQIAGGLPQAALRLRGCSEEVDLQRPRLAGLVADDVENIARIGVPPGLALRQSGNSAPSLQLMASEPAVPEVRRRREQLRCLSSPPNRGCRPSRPTW